MDQRSLLLQVVYNADSKLREIEEGFQDLEKISQENKSIDMKKKPNGLEFFSSDDMSWDYYGNPYFKDQE